jgi:MOZ/SAS family/MYST family zinc finger domain/RNA binding activity-knot of a chromodomain
MTMQGPRLEEATAMDVAGETQNISVLRETNDETTATMQPPRPAVVVVADPEPMVTMLHASGKLSVHTQGLVEQSPSVTSPPRPKLSVTLPSSFDDVPDEPRGELEPLQVGDSCLVRWRNNERKLMATVVARKPLGFRYNDKRNNKKLFPTWKDNGDAASSRNKRKLPPTQDENENDAEEIGTTNNIYTDFDPFLTQQNYSADQIEYYVHYQGFDRRLDEWVTLDKFELHTLSRQNSLQQRAVLPGSGFNSGNNTPRSGSNTPRNALTAADRRPSNGSLGSYDAEETIDTLILSGGNWHGGGSLRSSGGGGGNHRPSNDPALAHFEHEHEEQTKIKNIDRVIMADWEIESWYYSPFPASYHDLPVIYVCEFCLTYFRNAKNYYRHCTVDCKHRKPPGTEIYRHDNIVAFELDGSQHVVYCQKLCLLAKLFLDHKTLYYDTTPFMFYVVTQSDEAGHCHIVGYFSKEKTSEQGYNLACILTFPHYQKVSLS